jgi:gluconate 2-dehydrogenase gamma chain
MPERGITRRLLLSSGAALSALAAMLPGRALAETIRRKLPWAAGSSDRPEGIDDRPGYIFFRPAEAAFVEAAAARLIPSDATGPGAIEADVPRFIDRQLAGPYGAGDHFYLQPPFPKGLPTQGWQMQAPAEVYRAAIPAIERYVSQHNRGSGFRQLAAADQDNILKGLESGDVQLNGVEGKTFFTMLLQNTKEGYFGDPIYGGNRDMAAWKMIGFPGAHYDYREWVSRHGQRVPHPAVSLGGRPGWRKS